MIAYLLSFSSKKFGKYENTKRRKIDKKIERITEYRFFKTYLYS